MDSPDNAGLSTLSTTTAFGTSTLSVEDKNIVRVLSVTSINQLFIGLACMKKNSRNNNKYKDLFNNEIFI